MVDLKPIQSQKEALEKVHYQLAITATDDSEQTTAEIICRDQRGGKKRDLPQEQEKHAMVITPQHQTCRQLQITPR